ncbi:MAG: hypothetical protein IBJ11_03255 [Phycisphaerales bacterium]|nr:hypothetical protein [Phycisphaerales bacterium]
MPTRRRLLSIAPLALLFAVLASLQPLAVAGPEPDPVPRRWELQIEPGDLRVRTIDIPGRGAKVYFFLTYKVTNNSGQDLVFAPSFELVGSNGRIVRSGRDVPREATEAILAAVANPLLKDEINVQGSLLQGPENAREGLVIWPADDLKMTEASVYAAGFSGETRSVRKPTDGATVVLRKVRMLRHRISGELDPRSNAPLERIEDRWILR